MDMAEIEPPRALPDSARARGPLPTGARDPVVNAWSEAYRAAFQKYQDAFCAAWRAEDPTRIQALRFEFRAMAEQYAEFMESAERMLTLGERMKAGGMDTLLARPERILLAVEHHATAGKGNSRG